MDARLALRRTRLDAVTGLDRAAGARLDGYVGLAVHGLAAAYDAEHRCFPHTVRADPDSRGAVVPVGTSERYTAMAVLGLSRLPADRQRDVLAGELCAELADTVDARATTSAEFGAKALAAWCADEAGAGASDRLLDQLSAAIGSPDARPTVQQAWALTALVGARSLAHAPAVRTAAESLMAAQWPSGIFPHTTLPRSHRRGRDHVGCFADQVYPIQALARYFAAADRRGARTAAANRCADRIVELQGAAGQWWWHYDARTGDVVEGYPGLQRAPARDGADGAVRPARGRRRRPPRRHPGRGRLAASTTRRVDRAAGRRRATGAIWRKVGRREPRKAARTAAGGRPRSTTRLTRWPGWTAASRPARSTTSAVPTSSAGCSTPGCPAGVAARAARVRGRRRCGSP